MSDRTPDRALGARFLARRRTLVGCCAALSVMVMPRRPALAADVAGGTTSTTRLITVGGALTEIAVRLGAQPLLVAVDTTSNFPEAVRKLPQVGYMRSLSAEGVLSLRPTLLLASADAGPPAALHQLQAAGVRVVRTGNEHSFDAMIANVGLLADALGRRVEGERLVTELRREWTATRAALRPLSPPPKVLFILSHTANNVQVAGAGTAADAMIRLAGGTNALISATSEFNGYRPLSAEAVITAAPDVILTTREGLDAVGGIDVLLSRPGLALTPAGKARRVVAPDALLLLGFGPRLPQAVREVAAGLGTAA